MTARATDELQALNDTERSRLAHEEAAIEQGVSQVGKALAAIRDQRLYREDFATFEEYCRERWGIRRQVANRQIAAAEVAEALEPMGSISERQARELAPLRDNPDRMREVWQQANEATNGKPTADAIRAARDPQPAPEPDESEVVDAEIIEESGSDHPTTESEFEQKYGLRAEEAATLLGGGFVTNKDELEDAVAQMGDLRSQPQPTPPRTTGVDGKSYPKPQPQSQPEPKKPRERALTEQFFDAAYDLTKVAERIGRLADSDRFPQNAEKVATKHRSDLLRARDLLQEVIDRLPQP